MNDVDTIVKKLLSAKEAYYNDEPIMSDADFDALEDQLRRLDSDNDYFNLVGIAINNKQKVEHSIPMLSMAKGKVIDDILSWLDKIECKNEKLIIQPKIDGMSATVVYENGKLILIATRGDGKVGQDITHISNYIKLPKTVNNKNRIEVRGELYLPKNSKVSNIENKPLRNICVGLINRKDSGLSDLKHIKFIAYQIIGSNIEKESEKMKWLEDNLFDSIWAFYLDGTNQLQEVYDNYLSKLRNEWDYETDGLVITINDNTKWERINSKYEISHHNHYNIAWKPKAEVKKTILENIEWNVSRSGKLIPVAIVNPVVLGNSKVSRCSLNNYENVVRLKLEKGDEVEIEKAGEIIPYLTSNVTKNIRQR